MASLAEEGYLCPLVLSSRRLYHRAHELTHRMIPPSHSILLFLTLANGVLAGGVDSTNWGIPNNLRLQGNTPSKSDCGGAGSFFTEYSGKALCCSDKTRQKPGQDTVCPMGWSQHKEAKICIPPQEISNGDCGEGFKWNSNSKKCAPIPASGKCDGGQWYHDRSSSCCDDEWEWNPPKGDCPPGVACPKDWFWHKKLKECKPRKKRSPIPDCKDWNDKNQCCGHGPKPSGAVPTPGGGNGGGHGGGGWGGGGHGGGGHGGGAGGAGGHGGGGGGGGGGYGGGKGDHGGGKGDHGGGKGDKGDKGGHGGQGGYQGHHRREESEDTSVKRDFLGRKQDLMSLPTFPQSDLDKLYCPKGLHACSVVTPNDDEWSYECIDLATELESCGGCASTGHGQDCTLIPNAISVGCEFGSCSVYSCRNGFQTNGTDCVPI